MWGGDEVFTDRTAAGRALAEVVIRRLGPGAAVGTPLVLGLPRGGVPVGIEVARGIGADFDVVVARKIGLPWQPELGIGAVTETGPPVLNSLIMRQVGLSEDDIAAAVAAEREEVRRRLRLYRGDRPAPVIAGRFVIVVDDGLATGVTARAALRSLREAGPSRLAFAAPVCADDAERALAGLADDVICARTPESFCAVGRWYIEFPQLADAEVGRLLAEVWREISPPAR